MKRTELVNRTEYLLFRFALFKLRLLPYAWGRWLLTRLFLGIGYGLGIRRKVAEQNLLRAFPDQTPQERGKLLKKVYLNLGITASELYLLNELKLIASVILSRKEHADEALEMGRGAILATAHLGNWEAARVLPLLGLPLSVVVQNQHNPYFDAYNAALRTRQGVRLIDHRKGLKELLARLRTNEMVAILTDQNAGPDGLILDFMGIPASHWRGVAKLSLRHKVPIVPGFAVRTPQGGINIRFEPMIHHPELEDNEENQAIVLKELDQVIESYIKKYPEQWFWVHRRWRQTGLMRSPSRKVDENLT